MLHLTDLEATAIWVPPPPGSTVSNNKIDLLLAVGSPPSLTWPPTPWRVQKQAHATKASKVQELPPATLHLPDIEAAAIWVPLLTRHAVSNNRIELLLAVVSPPSLAWPPTPWRIKRQAHATMASKVQELQPATLRLADLEAAAIWVLPPPGSEVSDNKVELLLAVVSPPSLAWPQTPWKAAKQAQATTASKVQELQPATLHLADLKAAAIRVAPLPGPTVSNNKIELLLAVVSLPSLTWPPTPWRVQKQAHATMASKVQERPPTTLHLADLEAAAVWIPSPPRPAVSINRTELLLAVVSPTSLVWPLTPCRIGKQAQAATASKVQELQPATLHLADLEAAAIWVPLPPGPTVSNNKIDLLLAVVSPPSLTWPPTPWRVQKQAHATMAPKVQKLPPATLHLADFEATTILVPAPTRPAV